MLLIMRGFPTQNPKFKTQNFKKMNLGKINPFKEFKPTSWSIDNKVSIYIVTIVITLFGISSYINLPKENFPDIVIPTIYVSTINAGTSPADMENLITKKLEKEIKAATGVKKIVSNSVQDYSSIMVEFAADVDVNIAKQRVKDKVDKARTELPQNLTVEPNVQEVNFSDIPIMTVHISGDYDLEKLKKYAKMAQEKIEGFKEVTRVDMIGALDKEIQIDVDLYKMQIAQISTYDIANAIASENLTMSGGNIRVGDMKRSISVKGEFKDPNEVKNIIVKSGNGSSVYLKDIANINYGHKEQESFARLEGKNVISLNVIKRAGQNLIATADQVKASMADFQKTKFPSDLKVEITGDQSKETRTTLHDLINTIIIGFILVTIVLMFFMGTTNALFVGLSVPLSMFLAFLVMPSIGFSLNMIVLFAFLFALGIVVDDAIVVIENTHRIYHEEHLPVAQAAKKAAGEIFIPVLAGTLTTLAPFIPLSFLPGIVGKFMFFLPITLIITLVASLIVAFIINPVFAVSFMSKHEEHPENASFYQKNKGLVVASIIFLSVALIGYVVGSVGVGNFVLFLTLLLWINKYVFTRLINGFQNNLWPRFMRRYGNVITWAVRGKNPFKLLAGTIVLFIISIVLLSNSGLNVVFFPTAEPNFVNVFVSLPVGTDQAVTDSVTHEVEKKVFKILGEDNPIVESVISSVTIGASDNDMDRSPQPNKGKVSVAFVEYARRNGKSTKFYLDTIRAAIRSSAGVQISVAQEQNGPPTGKPINIEISGDEFEDLISISNNFIRFVDSLKIDGIEKLKSDLQDKKPELAIEIDRERANREGLSTRQIAFEIRTAVFGNEVSKFRDGEDENDIMVRYSPEQRSRIDEIMNLKITFRDMAMGGAIRQVPLSSVAKIKYRNTYGGITRINNKRVVTVYSNVTSDGNANAILTEIKRELPNFQLKEGYEIKITGEQEEQQETSNYLGFSLMLSIGMIILILVTQFNSISKTLIILSEILFSVIGVFLGYVVFRMDFVIIMTGIGIVGLAGIVVKNGILIVEFADELRTRGDHDLTQAVIDAGKIRLAPVVLTAVATILGLVPLAVGLNIDFVTLFTELNPHLFFGGDSVAFWGPLSWTIIFGLSFATFLTLVLVPAMYTVSEKAKLVAEDQGVKWALYIPFFNLFYIGYLRYGKKVRPYDHH